MAVRSAAGSLMHIVAVLLAVAALPACSMAASSRPIRLLAFGDSITEGWVQTKWTKTPYTWRLDGLLRKQFLNRQIEIVNGGIGSAGVLDKLNAAWWQDMSGAERQGEPWTHVVFLAGINDVWMFGRQAKDAFAVMPGMWRRATDMGATVLVIPPLPTNMTKGDAHEQQRVKLGQLIGGYVKQQNKQGNHKLVLFSLESTWPYHSMSLAKRHAIFDDGLHLTTNGYNVMADLIFIKLKPLMK